MKQHRQYEWSFLSSLILTDCVLMAFVALLYGWKKEENAGDRTLTCPALVCQTIALAPDKHVVGIGARWDT